MRRSEMGPAGGFLLVLLWALVVAFARRLLCAAGERRWAVAFGLATCFMATGPELICRLTANLVLATVLTGALAALGLLALRNRAASELGAGAEAEAAHPHPFALALAAAGFVLAAWSALEGHFFDEKGAHFGFVSAIARGLAPLEHPLFPGQPLRYHSGYDVLAAEVMAFTGLAVESALDVVTIASYLLLLATAAAAGAALGGKPGASLMIVLLPLGSSFLQRLTTTTGRLSPHWAAIPASWSEAIVPPVIGNFFQHPQGLGMAVSLGCVLLFDGDSASTLRKRRWAIGALYLGLVSAIQIVFFAALGFGIGAATLWLGAARFQRREESASAPRPLHQTAFELALLCASLFLALLLGGFLVSRGSTSHLLVFGKPYFDDPPLRLLLHHLVAFGLPLAALPFMLYRLPRHPTFHRVALLASAAVCFVIPNLMSYERSWDIVKFFTVGAFFLDALFADALTPLLVRPTPARRIALVLAVVLTASTSAWWLVRRSMFNGRFGIERMEDYGPTAPIALAVAARLAPISSVRERVLTASRELSEVGLLIPGWDWRDGNAKGLAIDRERADLLLEHRAHALRDLGAEDLQALEVRWIVLSPADVASLSPAGRGALDDPVRFERMFDVTAGEETRAVFRVRASTR